MDFDDDDSNELIEEAEKWELAFNNIADELHDKYAPLISNLSMSIRIRINKLLDRYHWEKNVCIKVFGSITRTNSNQIPNLLKILESFTVNQFHSFLKLFLTLKEKICTELIGDITLLDIHKLIDVTRFLKENEIQNMLDIIDQLSILEVLQILDRCNEPMANHCRLCRTRKIHALEFRMLQTAMPKDIAAVPGNIPLVEPKGLWKSDDNQGFSFQFESTDTSQSSEDAEIQGVVYWFGVKVDMMAICDSCLADVHRAVCCETRFDEIHHLTPEDRKRELYLQKQKENIRSEFLNKISTERARRRAREFSLRALQSQRLGIIKSKKEDEEQVRQRQEEEDRARANQEKVSMVQRAGAVDKRWKQQDARSRQVTLHQILDKADTTIHSKYDRANPVPRTREHPYSWRLAQFDEAGLPVESSAAAEYFGRDEREVKAELELLTHWKSQATSLNQELEAVRQEEQHLVQSQKRKNAQELRDTLHELKLVRQKKERLRVRAAEVVEEERLERRRMEKAERIAQKAREFERRNRESMDAEDRRSCAYEFYLWECHRIACELKEMAQCEKEQTRVDRFWGIPTMLRKIKEEEARQKREYKKRVKDMRDMCINVRVTRPFTWEVGLYRERDTNKIIK